MDNLPQHDLIESAINKLASIIPEPVGKEKLEQLLADRVPKAFYYSMLLDLLSRKDDRLPEIILTEAKFLVSLLLYKAGKDKGITPPQTRI